MKHYPMKSDVRERDDNYLLEIDLPGFQKENIKAYVEDGYLIVTAAREREKNQKHRRWIRQECYYGSYQRSFFVGRDISQEDLKAVYRHGVLRIHIPKESMEHKETAGKIQIA